MNDTRVSAKTERKLRDAMDRLLAGKPQHSDGRLTKNNLAQEAGVSSATMFRAKAVLAVWDTHIDTHGSLTAGEARRDADIADLRRQLTAAKREITELNRRLTAAATIIASFHHDNQMLRTENDTAGTVVPLPTQPRA
ncbi:hypothetical protein OHB05_14180 [Streptomyces sp. NBC_00638]|uniref:hypothetical protein n=1 Tax=Streptomyces sp. NBC_00638 TaxID=2975794 RepID=UPI00224DA2AC|nr:hypothetical protein [Streptomyces sp. NBC_00638]MCX5003771.1 hypothetical protein [Streptomyces sp. NBC_00638]